MQAPQYNAPPPDPTITALNQKAQADDLTALQGTAQVDTASIMARYGTRLAMANATTGSSLAVAPPPVASR